MNVEKVSYYLTLHAETVEAYPMHRIDKEEQDDLAVVSEIQGNFLGLNRCYTNPFFDLRGAKLVRLERDSQGQPQEVVVKQWSRVSAYA